MTPKHLITLLGSLAVLGMYPAANAQCTAFLLPTDARLFIDSAGKRQHPVGRADLWLAVPRASGGSDATMTLDTYDRTDWVNAACFPEAAIADRTSGLTSVWVEFKNPGAVPELVSLWTDIRALIPFEYPRSSDRLGKNGQVNRLAVRLSAAMAIERLRRDAEAAALRREIEALRQDLDSLRTR